MHMHFAPTEKKRLQRVPICGYVGINDEICTDPTLCTCPECLDWIRPDHDSPESNSRAAP